MPPVITGYSNATSQQMANLVALAYWQFEEGLKNPDFDGTIPNLPSGWTQIASFRATELDISAAARAFLAQHPEVVAALPAEPAGPALVAAARDGGDAGSDEAQLRAAAAVSDAALKDFLSTVAPATAAVAKQVFFGFALKADLGTDNPNIIVLRGTRTAFEWAADAAALQVPLPYFIFRDGKLQVARAHLGFTLLFGMLFGQIQQAAEQFDTSRAVALTGHSLGSALTTLGALAAHTLGWGSGVQLYDYASPRVGDPVFQAVYEARVPQTFRVANLSDLVPVLPPTSLSLTVGGRTFTLRYAHVGQEWSYLWQTGNVGSNHELVGGYQVAVQQDVETDAPRTYPTSGVCP
jgi:triacylglycerol lipase